MNSPPLDILFGEKQIFVPYVQVGANRPRAILLFDIERPEMTDDERRQVAAMFEAVDAFTGRKPEWEI